MQVSVFVHDLASNPIGRAVPIARALERLGHQVEILGFLLSGDKVYSPYKDLYNYKTIRCSSHFGDVLLRSPQLAKMATGDVIYGFKPLWTSFWPALLASRFGRVKPLMLDIDDNEWWFQNSSSIKEFIVNNVLRGWNYALSPKYTLLLHQFATNLRHKTVVSTKLQQRYGGRILLHGPDERVFNPEHQPTTNSYSRLSIEVPVDKWLVLFVGTPHPHKGIETILQSLGDPTLENFHLVLGGPPQHPIFLDAKNRLGKRCHLIGFVSYNELPSLLRVADIVAIPQLQSAIADAQVPAKLLDAMSMARIIVASRVSDIPGLLGENDAQPRGWTVTPGDSGDFSEVLLKIAADPEEAWRRAETARQYYLKHASTDAMAHTLKEIITKL